MKGGGIVNTYQVSYPVNNFYGGGSVSNLNPISNFYGGGSVTNSNPLSQYFGGGEVNNVYTSPNSMYPQAVEPPAQVYNVSNFGYNQEERYQVHLV